MGIALLGAGGIAAQDNGLPPGTPDFNGMWIRAKGGITFDPAAATFAEQRPPLRPEYLRIWQDRLAARARGEAVADPTANCIPGGLTRFLALTYPSEILQTPRQLNWFAEWNEQTVRIYLDGRGIPDDIYPTYNGYSRGHFEGDTLVVETIALRGDTLIDQSGIPHSEQMTVTMRMRKTGPDEFENEITLHDPVAFTRPWTVTKYYQRAPAHYRIMEYVCMENNRNPIGADGKVQVILPEQAQ